MSEALLFAEDWENVLCTKIILKVRNNFCTQHVLPRFDLGIFMYWTCNSMKNLSSYCGLVDAKIRASDKDLPVPNPLRFTYQNLKSYKSHYLNCDNSGTLHWNTSTITFHAVVVYGLGFYFLFKWILLYCDRSMIKLLKHFLSFN